MIVYLQMRIQIFPTWVYEGKLLTGKILTGLTAQKEFEKKGIGQKLNIYCYI